MNSVGANGAKAAEQVGALAGQAKGVVLKQIGLRAQAFGETLQTHAGDVRSVGDALRERGQESSAHLADVGADRLQQIGVYLGSNSAERMVADLEHVARKQPILTLGVGLVAGIVAARLLKASALQRYSSYGPNQASAGGGRSIRGEY